jgi:hypothetical protein
LIESNKAILKGDALSPTTAFTLSEAEGLRINSAEVTVSTQFSDGF